MDSETAATLLLNCGYRFSDIETLLDALDVLAKSSSSEQSRCASALQMPLTVVRGLVTQSQFCCEACELVRQTDHIISPIHLAALIDHHAAAVRESLAVTQNSLSSECRVYWGAVFVMMKMKGWTAYMPSLGEEKGRENEGRFGGS